MLYGKYKFKGILRDDCALPPYKGSTFRGVFGIALKKVVCALQQVDCQGCLLRQTCIYAVVFETYPSERNRTERKRIVAPPHPYVIEPPLDTTTSIKAGESFDLSLLLFGKVNAYLPYFVYAFEHMGRIGIGKKRDGRRAQFVLESVEADGRLVYSGKDRRISRDNHARKLAEDCWRHPEHTCSSLILDLKTPLRLKFQNRLRADLPFHVLIRAVLRRISSLYVHHGNGEPNLDYRGLVRKAENIETEQATLEWEDWRRYSNRQAQSMRIGGMIGSVTYSGDLSEFVPLLQFCEKVHLGKQTSFGLGQIAIRVIA